MADSANRKIKIKSVGFSYKSRDWSAFCTYYADRGIRGAHLSGNPPFVHEETGKVPKKALAAIFLAAKEVVLERSLSVQEDQTAPDPSWTAYEQIAITYDDSVISIVWQTNPVTQNPGESVTKLKEVILEHHIGGW